MGDNGIARLDRPISVIEVKQGEVDILEAEVDQARRIAQYWIGKHEEAMRRWSTAAIELSSMKAQTHEAMPGMQDAKTT